MMSYNSSGDVIAAIATAAGGGIGIVRISGNGAAGIIKKIFAANKKIKKFEARKLYYGDIVDPFDGRTVDEALVSFMYAPNSYTAEDTVEINCHGGAAPLKKILELVLQNGARLAEPGEFTKRAFLNGRIDLSQAEAVADIISAKTEAQAKYAAVQLEGGLSDIVNEFKEIILNCLARIEAAIDYPEHEDELGPASPEIIASELENLIGQAVKLVKSAEAGKIIRDGINAVIAGKPNVGKSSLLNALLKEDRAIVTDMPGTTRDALTESVNLSGVPLNLTDTAGIRETTDIIEKIGVERSEKTVGAAELIFLVLDGSEPLDAQDFSLIDKIKDKKAIIIINKSDLPNVITRETPEIASLDKPAVMLSAKSRGGISELTDEIKKSVYSGGFDAENRGVLSNIRHIDALNGALEHLRLAKETAEAGFAVDFISIDLTAAYERLAEITGDNAGADLIDKIFSEFCLGK